MKVLTKLQSAIGEISAYLCSDHFLTISQIAKDHVDEYLKSSKSPIIFSGVGKSFWMAEKIARVWSSLGIPSMAMDPIHALHGDCGLLTNNLIFAISKSGESSELNSFIKYIKNSENSKQQCQIIGICCNESSTLCQECPLSLILPDLGELDSRNKVPTISSSLFCLFLEAVGISIFESSETLKSNYASNHPAGKIGKDLRS